MNFMEAIMGENKICPFLPIPDREIGARDVSALGKERGEVFYFTTLCYGQTLWCKGFPAQALLQINRAFSADLQGEETIVRQWFAPYDAVAWIIGERPEGQFVGNPRRHYQHLATRMVEPRKDVRVWRAWACWAISCALLPVEQYPADEEQKEREGVIEPSLKEIQEQLGGFGWPGEAAKWESVLGKINGMSLDLSLGH